MSLGIPYMGSKRKLAKPIIDHIVQHNPNVKYFYDLFGGGGAMSFEALQRKKFKKVVYNELNTGVVELLRKIRTDGVTPEFYQWVDRETFKIHKNGNDWFGGLCKTCWSFGNNQKDYLFSDENEKIKRPLHEIIVNRCQESIDFFKNEYGLEIDNRLLESDNIQKRRIAVMQVVKKSLGRTDLQRLQQLEQLQRLQRLQRLEISNKSAFDVEIITPPSETIIYLDPPYIKTASYAEKMCHDELYAWIEKMSDYKIYMSSYESHLPLVAQFNHRSTLSAISNNKTLENLYSNKKETFLGTLF